MCRLQGLGLGVFTSVKGCLLDHALVVLAHLADKAVDYRFCIFLFFGSQQRVVMCEADSDIDEVLIQDLDVSAVRANHSAFIFSSKELAEMS